MQSKDLEFAWGISKGVWHTSRLALGARFGRFKAWPPKNLLLEDPLALAEAKTDRLRRIYEKCTHSVWDGPEVFREAVVKHGGIQLDRERRIALSHVVTPLVWGELGAWMVSAELAERLEDPDARMAASSQVFDEARHFYVLRDYLALLHVPIPALDPYFLLAVRALLKDEDLIVKLMCMQLLAEGSAQTIFQFLGEASVEPVLSEILPYIERDEARHVGLGVLHLPDLLAKLSPRKARRIATRVAAIGDLLGLSQFGALAHYEALGLDPRELFRRADGLLTSLSEKLGKIPGTNQAYFRTDDPRLPEYQAKLDLIFPPSGAEPSSGARWLHRVVGSGAKALVAAGGVS